MFESLFTRFELTDAEVRQIDALHTEFEAECAKHGGTEDFDKFPHQLFTDMAKKVSAIRDKAHSRALKYYAKHTDELISALKEEAIYCACEMFRLEDKSNSASLEEYFKHQAVNAISFYSELLPPVAESELLAFVDDAFKNRKKLYKERKTNGLPKQYTLIRQGIATNEVTKIAPRKKSKPEITLSGLAKFNRGDFMLTVKDYMKTAGVRTSVHQLFDVLCEALTRGGVQNPIVKIPLRDFMDLRGLKDEKSARQQIKDDLLTLSHFHMTFTERRRGKPTMSYLDLAIIGSHGIKNSFIVVAFDPAFIELFKTYNVMNYPSILWRLNAHNFPHAYYFGRKIAEHKNLNYGSPNEDIIAVMTILNSSPYMPTTEKIAQTKAQNYKEAIIDPFEENMNALEDVLTWEYCHSKGTPLTDKELSALYDKGGYHTFVTLLVQVHWRDFPARLPKPKKGSSRQKKTQQAPPNVIAL